MSDVTPPDPSLPASYPPAPPLGPPPSPVPPGAIRPGGSWPTPEPDEPPERRPAWVMVAAVVAAFALVAAAASGLAAVLGDDDPSTAIEDREDPDDDPSPTSPPTDPDQPVSEGDFDAVVQDIQDFVAAERGLPFLRDVTVELADDQEFTDRLLEDFDEGLEDLEVSGHVLQAIGLIPPDLDVGEAMRSLLSAGVVGFYDTETDELVVRGTDADAYVRMVMAHELTHALDDQHFELFRPEIDDAPDEAAFGFTVLVEGSASAVEQAYRASFTAEEEAEASATELELQLGMDISAIPFVLLESLSAPYLLGPTFVDALLDDGGQPTLDAAFETPPRTSESVLQPDVFLDGEGAVAVPSPAADGEEIDRHVLGAFGLAQLLGEGSLVISGLEPSEAVDGWGGDQYAAWLEGDRACLRANLVGDTRADTDEIASALEAWAASAPSNVEATVESGDIVTLTSCG
jgi:hypothetical protein